MATVFAAEKNGHGFFSKKKTSGQFSVSEGLEIVRSIVDVMDKENEASDKFITANRILELENKFENYERSFLNTVERRQCLPVCWEEIWKINRALKELVNHFSMIFNKEQIFRNNDSYSVFYDYQKKFLDNAKSFFTDYLKNRKYVYEILLNNQLELKNFMKIYFSRINTVSSDNIAAVESRLKILEIFEQINEINDRIQNSLNKIYVATGF